jgi:chemosensory pili system protein ChpC
MNSPATSSELSAQQEITDLSSMLLPMAGFYLLVPGVAVAEIIGYTSPEPNDDEGASDWSLGNIDWRNQKVPLVCYEAMVGNALPPLTGSCRIAILNNTGLNQQLEFFAILLQGTPRLLRLSPEDVETNNDRETGRGEKAHVRVAGQEAVIPDIQFVEKNIISLLELT